MAQLRAISPSSSPNLVFNGAKKPESANCRTTLCCSRNSSLSLELGARSSGLNGNAIVHQSSNRTQVSKNHAIRAVVASEKGTDVSGKSEGLRGKLNKVVLAYSGGLDTSVIVPWLRENYGCEVVCFTADVGQMGLAAMFLAPRLSQYRIIGEEIGCWSSVNK